MHEVIAKLKPKNYRQGNHFHLLDSSEINFSYVNNMPYSPNSLVHYQGLYYVRNSNTAGYAAGILPTNRTYFTQLTRDLGHFPTQAALDTAYPAPDEGAYASIGESNAFILFSNGTWNAIAGGGGGRDLGYYPTVDELMADATLQPEVGDFVTVSERRTNLVYHPNNGWVPFQGRDYGHFSTVQAMHDYFNPESDFYKPQDGGLASVENIGLFVFQDASNQWHLFGNSRQQYAVNFNNNLDTVSVPILFKGAISKITVDIPAMLNNYSFEAKLDSLVTNYTALSDTAALEAWINNNVTANEVKWILRIIAGYANEQNGETSLVFEFEKTYRL